MRDAYLRLYEPLVSRADDLFEQLLGPFRLPKTSLLMAKFGLAAMRSAVSLAQSNFKTPQAACCSRDTLRTPILPLKNQFTAAVGLMLSITVHRGGWPVAKGGSQAIADAMASYLQSLQGEIVVGMEITSLDELPECGVAPVRR